LHNYLLDENIEYN